MLDEAQQRLAVAPTSVIQAIDQLRELAAMVMQRFDHAQVRLDISELSGYGYHNGPVFAVYHPEHGSALAQGGRYDGVGETFGRARPATGFDVDLKNLIGTAVPSELIYAPWVDEAQRSTLDEAVRTLRADGQRVCYALSAEDVPPAGEHKVLSLEGGEWKVVSQSH